jgi:hypothetical protein
MSDLIFRGKGRRRERRKVSPNNFKSSGDLDRRENLLTF